MCKTHAKAGIGVALALTAYLKALYEIPGRSVQIGIERHDAPFGKPAVPFWQDPSGASGRVGVPPAGRLWMRTRICYNSVCCPAREGWGSGRLSDGSLPPFLREEQRPECLDEP